MWLVPTAIVALAAIPLAVQVRRVVAESAALRRELREFSQLRPALLELRADASTLQAGAARRARQLRRH